MTSEEKPPTNEADDFAREILPVEAELADATPNISEETIDSAGNHSTPSDTSQASSEANSITEFFVGNSPTSQIGLDMAAAQSSTYLPPPPLAKSMQNLSANGGAVGALVLGVWCLIGSFITNWSIINGFLGLILGFWGLSSRRQRLAWIGIALCLLGVLLSLADISALVNEWMNPIDENSVEF